MQTEAQAHFQYRIASRGRERLRTTLAVLASAIVLGLLAYGARALMSEAPPKRHQVQQISLVRPPVPPPPPPQVEKPKEEIKQEIKEPVPEDDSPPPDAALGLDAKGTSGSDGFGLAGRPGGREITSLGDTGNGDGRGFLFYANQLQAQLQDELNQQKKLRGSDYRATVALWIGQDGRVQRVDLTGSTGDSDTDNVLRAAIAGARRLKAPPANMPQPLRLRITSRGAG